MDPPAPKLTAPPIRLVQTADGERYKVLFDITSRASRRYCEVQNIAFHPYIGIKRGAHPWQATFNRIVILHEMITEGFRGWALYFDADAYPADMNFDIRAYLAAHASRGFIASAGGPTAYMPNAGILFCNLAKPAAREVITAWHAAFLRELSDTLLQSATNWIEQDDQYLLHPILHARGDADSLVHIESFDLIGWPRSSAFRQILRRLGTFRDRCERALAGVEETLTGPNA